MTDAPFVEDRVAIIGCGLIGGSIARALRKAKAAGEIVGCTTDRAELDLAVALGVIDRGEPSPALAVNGAGLVILAVPVTATAKVLAKIARNLGRETVITDVASVKAEVVAEARAALGVCFPRFVPGHPLAGTEKSGVEASLPDLFQQRRVVLTPVAETQGRAVARIVALWEALGAEVELLTPEEHDEALAATSHLPHLAAYALVNTITSLPVPPNILRFAAGGFADTTRIAASDPAMWRDIALANRTALAEVLKSYEAAIHELGGLVEAGDGEALLAHFSRAKQARDRFSNGEPD